MRQRGFLKLIILIIIGVILLGVLRVDVRAVLARPEVIQNISFVKEKVKGLWVVSRPARIWIVKTFTTYVVYPLEKADS